jgi:hypothetical protein
MNAETKRTLILVGLALFFSALVFLFRLFFGHGLCEAIVQNGGASCASKDRINFIASDIPIAVVYGIVSVFSGSIIAVVFVYIGELLGRKNDKEG